MTDAFAIIGFFAIIWFLKEAAFAAWNRWQARKLRPALERLADPAPLRYATSSMRLWKCGCTRTWCDFHSPERWHEFERQFKAEP